MLMLLGYPSEAHKDCPNMGGTHGKPCINILILILIYYPTTDLKNKYYKFQETGDKRAIMQNV